MGTRSFCAVESTSTIFCARHDEARLMSLAVCAKTAQEDCDQKVYVAAPTIGINELNLSGRARQRNSEEGVCCFECTLRPRLPSCLESLD